MSAKICPECGLEFDTATNGIVCPNFPHKKKEFHQANCRNFRGIYKAGDCISGLCTCRPCDECNGDGYIQIQPQDIPEFSAILDEFFSLYKTEQKKRGAKSGLIDYFEARSFLLKSIIKENNRLLDTIEKNATFNLHNGERYLEIKESNLKNIIRYVNL